MEKMHGQGFFCAVLNGDPRRYTLHLKLWDGREIEIEDPYRFGPLISDSDLYLHTEGTLHEAYRALGAHMVEVDGVRGVRFAVWAPNALNVTVAGEFNDWDIRRHPMRRRSGGVWELFLPALNQGRLTNTTSSRASPVISSSRPIRMRSVARRRQNRPRSCGTPTTTNGKTNRGWKRAPKRNG